ncbi:MAG: hypothetical protein QOG64_859 [Acidimicrobiaceae bacterium]|nr:hypothetical protein [Acidimicrobiaceae bacterium]
MINTAARLYLALALVAVISAVAYNGAIGDRAGALLLLYLFLAAAIAGVAMLATGIQDSAPRIAEDASPPELIPVGRAAMARPSNWPIVGGVALGLVALGLSLGAPMVVVGLVACAIAAGGWLGQVFREDPSFTPRHQARVWERVVGPIGVPLSALALTAFIVVCVSRVLLAVNEKVSVVVALAVAILVLAGFAFVAARPRSGRTLLGLLGGAALVALAAAGIAGAAKGERQFEPAAAVNPNVFSLTAKNTQFSKSQLTVKAGTEVTISFHNDDPGIYHNVGIYTAPKGGSPVADGQPIKGVDKKAYVFDIKAPGTYAFRCDFHANMVGTLTVQ